MINCIFDPVDFLKEEKYYSEERECPNCGKKTLLNKYFKICPECSQAECDFLMKYIDQMIVNEDKEQKALRCHSKAILSTQIIIINVKIILKNLFFIP